MAQQNTGGFGVASPVQYSPDDTRHVDIKDPQEDLTPSDSQPPGVDEDDDMPQSLEEALTG